MSTTAITTLVEPVATTAAAMSHRRQPARQARANPARAVTGGRTLSSSAPDGRDSRNEEPPGFFPGLAHFTDSIAALPREMVRQFTMLKEVDAKIARPEESLTRMVGELLSQPRLPRNNSRPYPVPVATVAGWPSAASSLGASEAAAVPEEQLYDPQRREVSLQLRMLLNNMVHTMDEKTHVMMTATDTLQGLLRRCESSWSQIETEISEETRLGNANHRALDTEAAPEKKPSAVGERPRREAAISNAHAALAEERETVRAGGSRRNRGVQQQQQQHQPLDSDFDEPRPAKSKARSRKTEIQGAVGLGIANGAGPNKRRKVEKASGPTSAAMDRTISSTQGRQLGTASPSQTPHVETAKKRARGNALATALGGRKRYVSDSESVLRTQ